MTRILTKRSDFRVATALPSPVDSVDELCQTSTVVVLDSLHVFSAQKNYLARPQDGGGVVRSLLIAMEDNCEHFLRAIRSGVSGYVLQDASAMDVVAAIRTVAQGDAVCPTRMIRALFDYVARNSSKTRTSHAAAEKSLTRREQELVPLIGDGLTNKEIAARLNLSEETIKSHVHRILRKVGAEDRRGVFAACLPNGMEV